MVQVPGMEWRHIDQRAVRSQPDGVVYRDQITGARNLYNLPVIEHPAELHPATGLFNLAADILEAVRQAGAAGCRTTYCRRDRSGCRLIVTSQTASMWFGAGFGTL